MASAENTLPDLLPNVRALSRADKLKLIQLLAVELAHEEGGSLVEVGASCPVWSPFQAFDAAAVLLRELQGEKIAP